MLPAVLAATVIVVGNLCLRQGGAGSRGGKGLAKGAGWTTTRLQSRRLEGKKRRGTGSDERSFLGLRGCDSLIWRGSVGVESWISTGCLRDCFSFLGAQTGKSKSGFWRMLFLIIKSFFMLRDRFMSEILKLV